MTSAICYSFQMCISFFYGHGTFFRIFLKGTKNWNIVHKIALSFNFQHELLQTFKYWSEIWEKIYFCLNLEVKHAIFNIFYRNHQYFCTWLLHTNLRTFFKYEKFIYIFGKHSLWGYIPHKQTWWHPENLHKETENCRMFSPLFVICTYFRDKMFILG